MVNVIVYTHKGLKQSRYYNIALSPIISGLKQGYFAKLQYLILV